MRCLPSRTCASTCCAFAACRAATAAHNHAYPHLCEACIQSLANAANLYRGEFLAGFPLPDAPEFEAWQLQQREALQRELSTILDHLAHAYAEAGRRQYDLAIAYARRWLALDSAARPAQRTLMRLYAEAGDRAAALRQYEECVRLLDAELGVEPEPETAALMAKIRQGALDGSSPTQPLDATKIQPLRRIITCRRRPPPSWAGPAS